jgi:phosphate transport system substrate-binding protein
LINGAGATFPYPLYAKWFSEFQKKNPDIQINYQPIGSGGGIRQFLEKTIDFGASDAPMTDEQMAKSSAPLVHIPTVLGAVVITYNLPGISKELRFTGEIIADIYLGKITKWNDPLILKANPGISLPDQAILVTRRSDGSGTTNIFTDYLSKVSSDWKTKVGTGTSVNWPIGLGAKGNDGVTGLVKQTPGSIGYVELVYAENNKLPVATIKNANGVFVRPSTKGVTAAAAATIKTIPNDFRVSIANAPGKESYPISSFTYLLIYKELPSETGKNLLKFLDWSLTDGQSFAESMAYAPLPENLRAKVKAAVKTIKLK